MKRIAFITLATATFALASAPFISAAQAPQTPPAVAATPSDVKTLGDAKAGAQNIQRCQGCHGIAGWRTAFPEVYRVPKIGGQHHAYLVSALKAYKSGERRNAGMRAIAVTLTDKEINDLAAYYAEAK
jgi:cytochrome c553